MKRNKSKRVAIKAKDARAAIENLKVFLGCNGGAAMTMRSILAATAIESLALMIDVKEIIGREKR